MSESVIRTREAAAIIGIGYEGLRSYLKRGLLGAPMSDPDRRWRWAAFTRHHLCRARLAKVLMDAGISFERAVVIVADMRVRRALARAPADPPLLAVSLPGAECHRLCGGPLAPEVLRLGFRRYPAVGFFDLEQIRAAVAETTDV